MSSGAMKVASRILDDVVAWRGLVEQRSVGLLSWMQRRGDAAGSMMMVSTGRLEQQS
jgi:hypothetical protein